MELGRSLGVVSREPSRGRRRAPVPAGEGARGASARTDDAQNQSVLFPSEPRTHSEETHTILNLIVSPVCYTMNNEVGSRWLSLKGGVAMGAQTSQEAVVHRTRSHTKQCTVPELPPPPASHSFDAAPGEVPFAPDANQFHEHTRAVTLPEPPRYL